MAKTKDGIIFMDTSSGSLPMHLSAELRWENCVSRPWIDKRWVALLTIGASSPDLKLQIDGLEYEDMAGYSAGIGHSLD